MFNLQSRIKRKINVALVASFIIATLSVIAPPQAQAALTLYVNDSDPALAFVKTNSTNIVGGGGTAVNDVVRYNTVGTYGGVAVDAVVTTLSISGSITNYDNPGSASTAAGYLNNWMINTSGGEARFRFEFFKAGTYTGTNTGIPVVLQNVKITSIDLDCSSASGSYQYTDATGFQKYSMMSPTNLAVQSMTSPNRVRFIANKTGSRSSVPEDQVLLKYDAVQKIEFSFGNVVAGSTNYFGLMFGGWPNGGTPVEYTNVFNTPPTTSAIPSKYAYDTTTISISDFGTYNDVDNNPFFSVVVKTFTGGSLQWYNGTSWVTVSAGQAILVGDIEKGYLRYISTNPSGTIDFYVNDGLDNSLVSYTLPLTRTTSGQVITFNNPGTKGAGSGSFPSNATTDAPSLTVTLTSLTPGICTVSGLDIVPVAAGTCVIVASQPGTYTYSAAADVKQEFQIVAGGTPTTPQTITFNRPDSMTVGVSSYNTNAASTSNLTVTLNTTTPSICSINGLTVSPIAIGNCIVKANQKGDSTYLPATEVTWTIPVYALAGGGTAPGVRTTGPKADSSNSSDYLLTGRIDTNDHDTIWQFCYLKTSSPTVTNGELKGSPTCVNASASSGTSTMTNNGTSDREVTANLTGLDNKTYHYQLVGWHSGSGKVYGAVWKFKPGSRPYLRTLDASPLSSTTATLNGEVKSSSSNVFGVTFCYSEAYEVEAKSPYSGKLTNCKATVEASPSTVNASSFTSVSKNISGLSANKKYFYQVITKGSSTKNGKTTYFYNYGNIVEFVTSKEPRIAVTGEVTGMANQSATVNGSVNANFDTTRARICVTETYTANTLSASNCRTGAFAIATPETITGGSGTSVKLTVSNLVSGVRYFYQVMADATGGSGSSVYGSIKSFIYGAPLAVTLSASGVKVTSGTSWEAKLDGFILANGETSTNYFCIGETSTVTSTGAMTECILGGGVNILETATAESTNTSASISLAKSGLNQGTTYYYQAIGRTLGLSPALDSFGEVKSFITAYAPDVVTEDVLSFGIETATVRGTLNANGLTTTGSFCISDTNIDPLDDDGYLDSCLFVISTTSPATTLSSSQLVTGDLQSLSQATTYYYQAIGTNAIGSNKGVVKSFTTLAGAPVAVTVAATNLGNNTATINGRVNPGGASTTVKFCYGTSSTLSGCMLTDTVTVLSATAGLTNVSFNLINLSTGQTYYYRVQGINSQGTTMGEILSFKAGAPAVQTLAATGVTGSSAILNGTAKANSANITSVKFCVSSTSAVGASGDLNCDVVALINANITSVSNSISTPTNDSVTVNSGISTGNMYYFQIVASTGSDTSYGNVLSFTAGAPEAVTKDATNVTASGARLNGLVNRINDSGASAEFCYSDSDELDPDGVSLANCINSVIVESAQFVSLVNDDPVYVDITGLSAGNTYFFQVKATSSSNATSIGEVLSFSTGYTVQFRANGGSGSMNNQMSNSSAALTTNAYTKTNATFGGWSTSAGGSVTYADGATYDFRANLVLYAIWNDATPAPTPTPTPKKKAKLTWGNPATINKGTALSGSQLNAVTDVPSVCVYSPTLGTVLPAGTYTLSVTCTPTDPNYEPISGTVTLIVKGKVKPQIIWFNPSPIVNPTPLSGTQLNALANVPGSYSYNPPAGTVLTPGKHPLNVHFKPTNTDDNEEMDGNVTIEVLEKKDAKPTPPPAAPVNAPDTKTAITPATLITLATAGKKEEITVRPTEDKSGVVVTAPDWSLQLVSSTKFVQNVTDANSRVIIEKGNTVTTSSTGFKPFSQVDVWIYSTPTWLGAVMTDQYGNFTTTLPMPSSLPEGDHTFQAKGQTPDSIPRDATVPITLVTGTKVDKPGKIRFEVYFGMNSPIVTNAEKARITKLVKSAMSRIAAGAKINVEIDGWVQPNPHPGDIKYLSTHRANNTANVLRSLGLKGIYTIRYPGLAKDNIPTARHASVIISWSKSK